MKDKAKQSSDHANKGIGVGHAPRNGPKREASPENFDQGLGSRSKSTKND